MSPNSYRFVQIRGDFRPENPIAWLPGQVAEKRKDARTIQSKFHPNGPEFKPLNKNL